MDVCPPTVIFDITVANFVGLNRTPALPLAVQGWVALIESGHCSNLILITADQSALVASVSGVPAGVLTYHHDTAKKELVVGLGYVLPEYRRCGVYDQLWDALVEKARDLGAVQITSTTFVTNTAMRAVAAQQGRVETQVWLDFAVPSASVPATYVHQGMGCAPVHSRLPNLVAPAFVGNGSAQP